MEGLILRGIEAGRFKEWLRAQSTQGGCRNTRISELNARFSLSRERKRAEDKILPEGPATIFPRDTPIATSIRTIEFRWRAKPGKTALQNPYTRLLESKKDSLSKKSHSSSLFIHFENGNLKQNSNFFSLRFLLRSKGREKRKEEEKTKEETSSSSSSNNPISQSEVMEGWMDGGSLVITVKRFRCTSQEARR